MMGNKFDGAAPAGALISESAREASFELLALLLRRRLLLDLLALVDRLALVGRLRGLLLLPRPHRRTVERRGRGGRRTGRRRGRGRRAGRRGRGPAQLLVLRREPADELTLEGDELDPPLVAVVEAGVPVIRELTGLLLGVGDLPLRELDLLAELGEGERGDGRGGVGDLLRLDLGILRVGRGGHAQDEGQEERHDDAVAGVHDLFLSLGDTERRLRGG